MRFSNSPENFHFDGFSKQFALSISCLTETWKLWLEVIKQCRRGLRCYEPPRNQSLLRHCSVAHRRCALRVHLQRRVSKVMRLQYKSGWWRAWRSGRGSPSLCTSTFHRRNIHDNTKPAQLVPMGEAMARQVAWRQVRSSWLLNFEHWRLPNCLFQLLKVEGRLKPLWSIWTLKFAGLLSPKFIFMIWSCATRETLCLLYLLSKMVSPRGLLSLANV